MTLVGGARERVPSALRLLPKQCKVVVVAQVVGEIMRVMGQRSDSWAGRPPGSDAAGR